MKKITLILLATSVAAHSVTFLSNGNITSGSVVLGTWSVDTSGSSGFGAVTENVGASGLELVYAGVADSPDTMSAALTITAASGYVLDEIVFSQAAYSTGAGPNNGADGGSSNWSVDYDGALSRM